MTSFASDRLRPLVGRLRVELGALPEALRGLQRINVEVLPPYALVTAANGGGAGVRLRKPHKSD
jgi:hypothetical protein